MAARAGVHAQIERNGRVDADVPLHTVQHIAAEPVEEEEIAQPGSALTFERDDPRRAASLLS